MQAPPPLVPAGRAWSLLCIVVVHWMGQHFTMYGRCHERGVTWWLWNYPKGYGGPVFTNRGGEAFFRPVVHQWRTIPRDLLQTLPAELSKR